MAENNLPLEIKEHYEKAKIAMDRKNYSYAIELLTHTINIKPDFDEARKLLRLAETKNFEENPPNALLRVMNKISSLFHMVTATIREIKGDRYSAISIYEKILLEDPKNVTVLVKLGNLLKIEGMKEASVVTLESALNISQNNAFAYGLLGEIYSDVGKYDKARSCFKKVLELRPNDASAERGLKNLDALTTIDKSFEKKDGDNFRLREVTE